MRDELLEEAITAIASLPGVEMDPDNLADDVFLLSVVWPDERDFARAVTSTRHALEQLVARKVSTTTLKYAFDEWESLHYQSRRSQGAKADMRIVFQYTDAAVRVLGFGHRHIPIDFYERMINSSRLM